MKYLTVNSKDFFEAYNKAYRIEENKNFLVYTDTPIIGYGLNKELFDVDYCKQNDIPGIPLFANCGACVTVDGDITLVCIEVEKSNIGIDMINAINEFLKSKKLDSFIDNNDVLIKKGKNQYKVASYARGLVGFNKNCITGVHISYNIDENLINSICLKEQVKSPKALSSFGIDFKELKKFVEDFLDKRK